MISLICPVCRKYGVRSKNIDSEIKQDYDGHYLFVQLQCYNCDYEGISSWYLKELDSEKE